MGNTLSCCVSPGGSPTLSGRSGLRGQELRHQERIDAYRVEAELREPEPSPGTNLQHISDREAPEGVQNGKRTHNLLTFSPLILSCLL